MNHCDEESKKPTTRLGRFKDNVAFYLEYFDEPPPVMKLPYALPVAFVGAIAAWPLVNKGMDKIYEDRPYDAAEMVMTDNNCGEVVFTHERDGHNDTLAIMDFAKVTVTGPDGKEITGEEAMRIASAAFREEMKKDPNFVIAGVQGNEIKLDNAEGASNGVEDIKTILTNVQHASTGCTVNTEQALRVPVKTGMKL